MYKKKFEKKSEKVLPEKIKTIKANSLIDIIIINCGKYFEVQRINYKHEIIYKKEGKKEIFDIVYLNISNLILVIYADKSYEIINIDTNEILYSDSFDKIKTFQDNKNNYDFIEPYSNDEHKKVKIFSPLNLNSFSKLDLTQINYFEYLEDLNKDIFYIMDKNNHKIYLNQRVINPLCEIEITNENFIKLFPFLDGSCIYISTNVNNDNILSYDFYHINPKNQINENLHDNLFKLKFCCKIIDYLIKVLNLSEKILYKTKCMLFDKYIDGNNLTFTINDDNTTKYKNDFKDDLKQYLYFGLLSERLNNMITKELAEKKILVKMDEKIHFNIKNVQDIIIENIKPALNRINIYIKESIVDKTVFENINNIFININTLIDQLLCNLIEISVSYRNFLSWINLLNNERKNENTQEQIKKEELEKVIIDNQNLSDFINNEMYDFKEIYTFFENKKLKNQKKYFSKQSFFSELNNSKNQLLQLYLKDNKLNNDIIKENNNDTKKDNVIINHLENLKQLIVNNINNNYLECCKNIKYLNKSFFSIIGLNNIINNFEIVRNESNEFIIYFTSKENDRIILFIIAFNINMQFKFTKINLSFDPNINLIDYKITNKNELLFLVKRPINKENEYKFSLILSEINNYNFIEIKPNITGDKIILDISNYSGSEDIRMNIFTDVECSENSFLCPTGKTFVTLVDNSIGKITVIDIIDNY